MQDPSSKLFGPDASCQRLEPISSSAHSSPPTSSAREPSACSAVAVSPVVATESSQQRDSYVQTLPNPPFASSECLLLNNPPAIVALSDTELHRQLDRDIGDAATNSTSVLSTTSPQKDDALSIAERSSPTHSATSASTATDAESTKIPTATAASTAPSAEPIARQPIIIGAQPKKVGFCIHGARRSECRHCGGPAICEHGRRRRQCTTCCGSGICQHNKRRSRCKVCNGDGVCEHYKLKARCKICVAAEKNYATYKTGSTAKLESLRPSPHDTNSAVKLFRKDVAALKLLPQAAAKMFMALPESAFGINNTASTSHDLESKKHKRDSTNARNKSDLAFLLPKQRSDQNNAEQSAVLSADGQRSASETKLSHPPNFTEERVRRATFKNWPHVDIPVSQFVRAGFIFDPTPAYPDQCKCFCCLKLFTNWKPGDDPRYVHGILSPDCEFIKVSEKGSRRKVKSKPAASTPPAADVVCTSGSVSATPATKKRLRATLESKGTITDARQEKVKKLPPFSSAPVDFFPQFMPQMPPFHPMAHALGMLPFMMQAQQYPSFMPDQSLQELALQQPNFPPNFPLLFDPALLFASACYPATLSALSPDLHNFHSPQLGQGDLINIPGSNVDSEQLRAQNQ